MEGDCWRTISNLELKLLQWIGLVVSFARTICTLQLSKYRGCYGGWSEGKSAVVTTKHSANSTNFGRPYRGSCSRVSRKTCWRRCDLKSSFRNAKAHALHNCNRATARVFVARGALTRPRRSGNFEARFLLA